MARVELVDTSVLCNLLPVPGLDGERADVIEQYRDRRGRGTTLILPVTTVIETGNHIAHVPRGHDRRTAALRFEETLRLVVGGQAPWTLHEFVWGAAFLDLLLSGASTSSTLVEHAVNEVGVGDLCIHAERQLYRERSRLADVGIWSIDHHLLPYT